ncbi:MAG: response regulator [Bacteroidetes bacterium]|nr:response regulator [Bacteroidota bacterium]
MITAIAIDDEPVALEIIESFSSETNGIELLSTFTSTMEAIAFLQDNEVDLIFLDIRMPAITGLDFAQNIIRDQLFIFTTAYSEYAVEGFNLRAVDYLLKPFSLGRFQEAVSRAKDWIDKKPAAEFITVRSDRAEVQIAPDSITHVESFDDHIFIHFENEESIKCRMPLKDLMKILPETFVRIHRSFVVNGKRVVTIRANHVQIQNLQLPIGKTYRETIAEFILP